MPGPINFVWPAHIGVKSCSHSEGRNSSERNHIDGPCKDQGSIPRCTDILSMCPWECDDHDAALDEDHIVAEKHHVTKLRRSCAFVDLQTPHSLFEMSLA